ncbi:hypothetical protein GC197_02240 [bacterium]|nr:hypothetical protein [bacterium]
MSLSILACCCVNAMVGICHAESSFDVSVEKGAITRLQYQGDSFLTNYLHEKGRLGGVLLRYKQEENPWTWIRTEDRLDEAEFKHDQESGRHLARFEVKEESADVLTIQTAIEIQQSAIFWSVTLANETSKPLRIGDLSTLLPMNSDFSTQHPRGFQRSRCQRIAQEKWIKERSEIDITTTSHE